jgi:hypothetical protein
MGVHSPWIFGAMALAALAACNQTAPGGGGASTSGAGPTSAGSVSGGHGATLSFADMPHPRAGLWQVTIDDGSGQPTTMIRCYGDAPSVGPPPNCAKLDITRNATGAVVADMDCGDANGHFTSHSVATGDYQNEMHSAGTTTVTGADGQPRTSNVRTDGKYLGACPAGMHPDDIRRG